MAQLSIDSKGRMMIPARHRDALSALAVTELTLTRHPDGCLLLMPRAVWLEKEAELAGWGLGASAYKRILLGSATDVEMDGAGRILLPAELRSRVSMHKDILMIGSGSYFELWDERSFDEREQASLAGAVPAEVAGFTF